MRKGGTTREKERKGSEGKSVRVDVESSTLHDIDGFTVGERPEQWVSDLNCSGRLMPESLPKLAHRMKMKALPWTSQLGLLGSSGPLQGSDLRFPLS
jgi:hypothetical protein